MRRVMAAIRNDERGAGAAEDMLVAALAALAIVAAMTAAGVSLDGLLEAAADRLRAAVGGGGGPLI